MFNKLRFTFCLISISSLAIVLIAACFMPLHKALMINGKIQFSLILGSIFFNGFIFLTRFSSAHKTSHINQEVKNSTSSSILANSPIYSPKYNDITLPKYDTDPVYRQLSCNIYNDSRYGSSNTHDNR